MCALPAPVLAGVWPEDDLVRRICRVLTIAARTTETLAAEGYIDPDEPEAQVGATKIVGETALLLFAITPAARTFPELRRRIAAVATQLIPYARAEALRVGLCMRPALARDYGLAHVCLSAIGYPDAVFDDVYRRSVEVLAAGFRERVPYRIMEQRWIDRVWSGGRGRAPEDARTARNSMLGRSPGALIASREDVYAFTHALLYASDFGQMPTGIPRPKRAILEDAEAALARCLDMEDYDLAGEVLLAWPLLGCRWSASASFAFRVLARVEDEVGFLPAPTTRVDRFHSLGRAEDRRRYVLATAYHTAYVMGVLCAMMLRPGGTRAASGWRAANATSETDYEKLRDLLRGVAPRSLRTNDPHWLADLDLLPLRERIALSPLLLTVALQRAAMRGDIGHLRAGLEIGLHLRIASGPVAREAVRVLRSTALMSANIATSASAAN